MLNQTNTLNEQPTTTQITFEGEAKLMGLKECGEQQINGKTNLYIIDYRQQRILYIRMQCPTHKKKLEKRAKFSDELCEICGRKAALECRFCNYLQCEDCRICNQRHNIIKIVQLNKLKVQYSNNSYGCDSCLKSATFDDDGIWHCNTCNYGLCPDCAQ